MLVMRVVGRGRVLESRRGRGARSLRLKGLEKTRVAQPACGVCHGEKRAYIAAATPWTRAVQPSIASMSRSTRVLELTKRGTDHKLKADNNKSVSDTRGAVAAEYGRSSVLEDQSVEQTGVEKKRAEQPVETQEQSSVAASSVNDFRTSAWNVPNALSAARIVAVPFVGWWILSGQYEPALVSFTLVVATDFLDGFIARRFQLTTVLGSFLDPMADKLLVVAVTGCLWYTGLWPGFLCGLLAARDIGLMTGTAIYRFKAVEPPRTLRRLFDVQSVVKDEVRPTLVSKVNMVLTGCLMSFTLARAAVLNDVSPTHPSWLRTNVLDPFVQLYAAEGQLNDILWSALPSWTISAHAGLIGVVAATSFYSWMEYGLQAGAAFKRIKK